MRVLFALLFVFVGTGLGQASEYVNLPAYNYGSSVDDKTNIQDVEAMAKASTSLPNLLSKLKREIRSRPIFMFDSRGLHFASPEKPRIILFSYDASFIIAFPLDPKAKSAEMAQRIGSGFLFKEIQFRSGEIAKVSPSNPPKCLECHQSPHRADVDPRPNWEPYPRWGGALGQEDKKFTAADGGPHLAQEQLLSKIRGWQKGTEDPIIKLLDLRGVVQEKNGVMQTMGPISLTHKLAHWNFRRVARLMTQTPVYWLYRKEIVGCLRHQGLGETAALSLMPRSLADLLGSHEIPSVSRNYERGIFGCLTRIFSPHGIDTTDWPMAFRIEEVRFDQFTTPERSGMELYNALREFDRQLPEWNNELETPKVVSSLTEGAAAKLLGSTRQAFERLASGETLLNRCQHCHSGKTSIAPFLDLSREGLRENLSKNTYPRGTLLQEIEHRIRANGQEQMPPRNRLKDYEANALINFLKSLN